MDGPDVGWYLIVAAFLFGIGALGVMMRRSPLIVLLSLELMLNAANLTLIAFEITSIVLLVAAIGGVVLGTTREKEEEEVA